MPFKDKITGKRDYNREYAAYKERRKANPEHDEHCRKLNLASTMKFYWKNKEKLSLKNNPKRKKYSDEYRIKNREILKVKSKKYYEENKQKHRAGMKKYVEKNKDKISKQRKAYRLQHIKYLRAWAKEYGKRNRKKITKKYLERLKTDPNFRLICYARSRMNFFLKGRKSKTTMELLGVPNLEFLWQHLEKQFQLGMTKENYGKWHVDHIIPCASFDFSDPEQQKKCFHYTNLQPLWASDNISKGSKIISGDITSPKM